MEPNKTIKRIGQGIIATLLVLLGCADHSKQSTTSHDVGNIAPKGDTRQKLTCYDRTPQDSETDQLFKTYIDEVVNKIIRANKEVIPSFINEKSVCANVQKKYEVNANAMPTGNLNFYRGILWITDTDAEFAMVAAHELAHLISAHGMAPHEDKGLRNNQEYLGVLKRIRSIYFDIAEYQTQFDRLSEFLEGKIVQFKKDGKKIPGGSSWDFKLSDYKSALYALSIKYVSEKKLKSDFVKDKSISDLLGLPFDRNNRGISNNLDPKELEFKNIEELVRIVQDLRLDFTTHMKDKSKDKLRNLEKSLCEKSLELAGSDDTIEKIFDKKVRIEKEHLGPAKGSNWQEQDADEKGLELYLRAGFEPSLAKKLLQQLGRSRTHGHKIFSQLKDLDADQQSASDTPSSGLRDHLGEHCNRGRSSHPAPCWRAANIDAELKKNQKEYSKIIAKNPIRNGFGGKLKELQNAYFEKTMTQVIKDEGQNKEKQESKKKKNK